MFNRILVTEGGPHPMEDWARVSCEDLIPLDGLPSSVQSQGMVLRGRLIELLTDHYKAAQKEEVEGLVTRAETWREELKGHPDFGHLFAEIQAAALYTPWQGHITGPEVVDAIRSVITQHIQHIRHIERLCHADRYPDLKEGQDYRARHGLPPSPGAATGAEVPPAAETPPAEEPPPAPAPRPPQQPI